MKAGDTFKLVGEDIHLWMILSDPDLDAQRVLLVNFTSWKPTHDQSCVLDGHEHPFLHHRSCVNYPEARLVSVAQLTTMQANGLLEPHERLNSDLLRRVRNCSGNSRIALKHYQLLDEQGLLDFDD